MTDADAAQAERGVRDFFSEFGGASLQLPSGWFGRPFDNFHQLAGVRSTGAELEITLDDVQVLTLHIDGAAVHDGRVLSVPVLGGRWEWTGYGGSDRHTETVPAGEVRFHAPYSSDPADWSVATPAKSRSGAWLARLVPRRRRSGLG